MCDLRQFKSFSQPNYIRVRIQYSTYSLIVFTGSKRLSVGRCTFSSKTVVLFTCLGQFTVRYASVNAGMHNVRGTVTQLISSDCECVGKLITSSYSDKIPFPVLYVTVALFVARKSQEKLFSNSYSLVNYKPFYV